MSHTELFLFRGVVHAGVPDRLGERESSLEWYHAHAQWNYAQALLDPSFKLTRGGEGSGERSEGNGHRRFCNVRPTRPCVCVCVCPLYTFARTYVYVYWRRLANEEGQAPLTFFNSTRDGQCDIPPPPRFIALLSTLLLCFEDVEREEGSTRSSLAVEERMDDKRTRQGTSRFEHAFTRVSSNALSFQRFDEK